MIVRFFFLSLSYLITSLREKGYRWFLTSNESTVLKLENSFQVEPIFVPRYFKVVCIFQITASRKNRRPPSPDRSSSRNPRDSRDLRDPRDQRDPRNPRDPRDPRESRDKGPAFTEPKKKRKKNKGRKARMREMERNLYK